MHTCTSEAVKKACLFSLIMWRSRITLSTSLPLAQDYIELPKRVVWGTSSTSACLLCSLFAKHEPVACARSDP